MSSITRFAHLVRRPIPVGRDTRFASTWRDAAGRGNGVSAPTERLLNTVAASVATHKRVI
jgi:hypothetical protein